VRFNQKESAMQATEILMNEHRVIEQVLDCLEALVARTRKTGALARQTAEDTLEFFREFADHCHHGKEENHLFPWLERRGFSRQMGPTGVMRREHTLGRHYIQQMSGAVAGAAQGNARDVETFCHNAGAYIQLLREHIHKEDHCLFAMADQVATPEDDAELLEAYAAVEEKDIGAGVHEKYLALAESLAVRLGVANRVAALASSSACGCGQRAR
jgi:hemerythrin-like domain-containing protein